MEILEKLFLERYEGKQNNDGSYSFGIKFKEKNFIYLQTNPEQKTSIENWKNNFSSAYKINLDEDLEQIVMFSIEGISTFDLNLDNRKDYYLDRNSNEYMLLENLNRNSKECKLYENLNKIDYFYKIESIFSKIVK